MSSVRQSGGTVAPKIGRLYEQLGNGKWFISSPSIDRYVGLTICAILSIATPGDRSLLETIAVDILSMCASPLGAGFAEFGQWGHDHLTDWQPKLRIAE
jgi:hypothetical protein